MSTSTYSGEPVQLESFLKGISSKNIREASTELAAMMGEITGQPAQLWNKTTLGFDSYRYHYESGRTGQCHTLGFRPATNKISIYLMDGTAKYASELAQLGPHTTGKSCLYLTKLEGIDLEVLRDILATSYAYVSSLEGNMHRA